MEQEKNYWANYLIDVNGKISYTYVKSIKICHVREKQVCNSDHIFLMGNKKVDNVKEYCEGNYIKTNLKIK